MVAIDRVQFGLNVQAKREAAGISAYQVARACGVGLTNFRRWEMGHGLPSLDSLCVLCVVLCCHIDDLLQGAVCVVRDDDNDDGGTAA